ncbi:MAG TPA: molybdopterin-binding protein [Candidatus Limnocylindrales bacterium]|nr:molybdopterin-binding protein [Candidatus Limnocylindrales bacterium]
MDSALPPLLTAELLSIGTELTVGETRDTNAGDLARDLTARGVIVGRISALPDDLPAVTDAFRDACSRAELVISTGGLGPTPDDLTREAVAALLGETPAVDPDIETWLRDLFERRNLPYPEANRKQAWLIPSGQSIPNENGTAPGWLVSTAGGQVIVILPGPPREMRPMWAWVVERLSSRGLGRPIASVTLRLQGIGESAVADRLGDALLAGSRPMVATYARQEAVDIRIWAHEEPGDGGPDVARRLVADTERHITDMLGDHVWARGETTWPQALATALEGKGWRMAAVEVGMRGALLALLGEGLGERLAFGETLLERPEPHDGHRATLEHLAERVRDLGSCEVGLAVDARERGGDTAVTVAVVTPEGSHRETRVVFLAGSLGRARAANAAAAILLNRLRAGGGDA